MSTPSTPPVERSRKTKSSVLFANKASSFIITVGGIGTIAAVLTVGLYLIGVTLPLFTAPTVEKTEKAFAIGESLHLNVDEYLVVGWRVDAKGTITSFGLPDGALIEQKHAPDSQSITAIDYSPYHNQVGIGYRDGSVALATIDIKTKFPTADQVPASVKDGEDGARAVMGNGVVERLDEFRFRQQEVYITWSKKKESQETTPVSKLDVIVQDKQPTALAYHESGKLTRITSRARHNMMTGKTTVTLKTKIIDLEPNDNGIPMAVLLRPRGVGCMVVWENGIMHRYELPSGKRMERMELFPDESAGSRVSTVEMALGRGTVLVGDDKGYVHGWFGFRPSDPAKVTTEDGLVYARTKLLDDGDRSPITAINGSQRRRIVAFGHENGHVSLYFLTNQRKLSEVYADGPISSVTVAPKDNMLMVQSEGKVFGWKMDSEHPESSFAALFQNQWYEGYERPDTVWQSSSASDDSELKLSLWPLIVGTLKATVYAMIFAVPIAIGAAVYSAEFLNPKGEALCEADGRVYGELAVRRTWLSRWYCVSADPC